MSVLYHANISKMQDLTVFARWLGELGQFFLCT